MVSSFLEVMFCFLFFVLVFFSTKVKTDATLLSLETTTCLKGLCCISIFLHHFGQRTGGIVLSLFTHFGYFALLIFLMISGYGVIYGLKNKEGYLKHFLKRRCLKILLCYWLMNIFMVIYNIMVYGDTKIYNFTQFIDIFIKLKAMYYPESWYFVIVLFLYLIFYLVVRFTDSKQLELKLFLAVSVVIALCIIIDTPLWYYNYLYAFNIGIHLYLKNQKAVVPRKKLLKWENLFLLLMSFIFFAIGKIDRIVAIEERHLFVLNISAVLALTGFAIAIMRIIEVVSLHNRFLQFIGKTSVSIYMIHICVITFMLEVLPAKEVYWNNGICLWISFTVTVAMGVVISLGFSRLKKDIRKKNVKV